jgi:hypothetical protein
MEDASRTLIVSMDEYGIRPHVDVNANLNSVCHRNTSTPINASALVVAVFHTHVPLGNHGIQTPADVVVDALVRFNSVAPSVDGTQLPADADPFSRSQAQLMRM